MEMNEQKKIRDENGLFEKKCLLQKQIKQKQIPLSSPPPKKKIAHQYNQSINTYTYEFNVRKDQL